MKKIWLNYYLFVWILWIHFKNIYINKKNLFFYIYMKILVKNLFVIILFELFYLQYFTNKWISIIKETAILWP